MGEPSNTLAQTAPAPQAEAAHAPPAQLEAFFREAYRPLVRIALYAGGTREEAEDAASDVIEDVTRRWDKIAKPLAYARKAVVSNLIKEKTRGMDRDRRRQVEPGLGAPEAGDDRELTLWEDVQWVVQLLNALPPAQRDVMAFIVDEFAPAEIAALFGKTPEAVRQNLRAARQRLKSAVKGEDAGETLPRPKESPAKEELA